MSHKEEAANNTLTWPPEVFWQMIIRGTYKNLWIRPWEPVLINPRWGFFTRPLLGELTIFSPWGPRRKDKRLESKCRFGEHEARKDLGDHPIPPAIIRTVNWGLEKRRLVATASQLHWHLVHQVLGPFSHLKKGRRVLWEHCFLILTGSLNKISPKCIHIKHEPSTPLSQSHTRDWRLGMPCQKWSNWPITAVGLWFVFLFAKLCFIIALALFAKQTSRKEVLDSLHFRVAHCIFYQHHNNNQAHALKRHECFISQFFLQNWGLTELQPGCRQSRSFWRPWGKICLLISSSF